MYIYMYINIYIYIYIYIYKSSYISHLHTPLPFHTPPILLYIPPTYPPPLPSERERARAARE